MKTMQSETQDRFGVPKENILAAKRAVKKYRNVKLTCYVPTRKEILESDPSTLSDILISWMCNSPLEIIPSTFQVNEVLALLQQRQDLEEVYSLVRMCQQYPRNK